jgi:hypothetical protein
LPLLERALAIDKAAYGPDHLEVATDLEALAEAHRDLGDMDTARTLHTQAEEIKNRAL